MQHIISTSVFFFALRLISLSYSIRNEKRILKKEQPAWQTQFSATNVGTYCLLFFSLVRGLCSTLPSTIFPLQAFVSDALSWMLFYVIYKLRDVWTVKLYIVPDQRLETSFLFPNSTHPESLPKYYSGACRGRPTLQCLVHVGYRSAPICLSHNCACTARRAGNEKAFGQNNIAKVIISQRNDKHEIQSSLSIEACEGTSQPYSQAFVVHRLRCTRTTIHHQAKMPDMKNSRIKRVEERKEKRRKGRWATIERLLSGAAVRTNRDEKELQRL